MRFRTYPKIGGGAESMGGSWVATEKIHGANFVIGVDGDVVSFGKRKAWLATGEVFFGWQLLAKELEACVRVVARELGVAQVVCFGELFGGGYPHPGVAPIAGLSAVQTGIWYAPDLRWAMFDVLVATNDDDDGELLAFSDMESLAGIAALTTPPVIARGKYGDIERWPISGPTELPTRFGLPPIADNLREGFVAKPDRRCAYNERPIVKKKLADFDDARFDAGEAWDLGQLDADALIAWARRLVNPARVASARSKVGEDPAVVIDEIVLDVGIDLETVFAQSWRALGDREAHVLAMIRAIAHALLK